MIFKKVALPKRNIKTVVAIFAVSMYVMLVNINMYNRHRILSQYRELAKDLGGGNCEIEPLAEFEEAPEGATRTLLASFPGSGKRFTWSVIKAMTNYEVADDWDFSGKLKHDPLTVKTSWPHKQGVWSFEDHMDQVILLIRNPRWALPSYHTLRFELDYADNWLDSYVNLAQVYTKRSNIATWEDWRDERFEEEMQNYIDFLDFWMSGGITPGYDSVHPRCRFNKIECFPKVVLDFDTFYNEHATTDFFKLSTVLGQLENVEVIAAHAQFCVLDKVYEKKSLHNGNRNGNGPQSTVYRFTSAQLQVMEDKLTTLKDKYDGNADPVVTHFVTTLTNYIAEVNAEKQFEAAMEAMGL